MENKTLETKFEDEEKRHGMTRGLTKAVLTAVLAGAVYVSGCGETNYDSAARERAEDQQAAQCSHQDCQGQCRTAYGANSVTTNVTPSDEAVLARSILKLIPFSQAGYIPRTNNAPSSNFAPKSYSAPKATYTPVRSTYTPSVSRGGFGAVGRSFGGGGFSV